MNVLLVSGTRDDLPRAVQNQIYLKLMEFEPTVIIHGACGLDADDPNLCDKLKRIGTEDCGMKGVDRVANEAAWRNRLIEVAMPAHWERARLEGNFRSAGPIRNEAMVATALSYKRIARLVKAMAFPKGKSPGTRGAIDLVLKAGLTLEVVEL